MKRNKAIYSFSKRVIHPPLIDIRAVEPFFLIIENYCDAYYATNLKRKYNKRHLFKGLLLKRLDCGKQKGLLMVVPITAGTLLKLET